MEVFIRASTFSLLTLLHLISVVSAGATATELTLFGVTACLRSVFFLSKTLTGNLAEIIVWLQIDFSFMTYPGLFYLVQSPRVYCSDPSMVLGSGFGLLIAVFLTSYFPMNRSSRSVSMAVEWNDIKAGQGIVVLILLLCGGFIASGVCHYYGISVMGSAPDVVLPYKIGGVLNQSRAVAIPLAFAVVLDMFLMSRGLRRYVGFVLGAVSLWGIVEMGVRISKGALLNALLPSFLVLFYRGLVSSRLVILSLAGLAVTVLGYSVIENVRDRVAWTGSVSLGSILVDGVGDYNVGVEESKGADAARFLTRIFKGGQHFDKMYPHMEDFFWDSKLDEINRLGGPYEYHTVVIDGFEKGSVEAVHSSGICGFSEAFLIGGYWAVVATAVVLALVARRIDDRRRSFVFRSLPGRVLICSFLIYVLIGGFWSLFYIGLQSLMWPFVFVMLLFAERRAMKPVMTSKLL